MPPVIDNIHVFPWTSVTVNNCNTYLIDGPTRILIDPGHRSFLSHVEKGLQGLGLDMDDVGLVLCTHAHPDHIEGALAFSEKGVPFAMHEEEWRYVNRLAGFIKSTFGIDPKDFPPDFFLKDGDLDAGGTELKVLHSPGHSPGSVAFFHPETGALFSGDVIFQDGMGRTDFPEGDPEALKASIRRLSDLNAEFLLSGHGDLITGKDAVRANFDNVRTILFGYL